MELVEFEQEVDSIIQRYGIKTDSPFHASRPPTTMSSEELHDYLKTSERLAKSEHRPPLKQERIEAPWSNLKENDASRAMSITKAMRALQDRIKVLESEKASLNANFKEIEQRYSTERNKWQHRVIEEASQSSSKEKAILSRFAEIEAENTSLNERNLVLQEHLKIQESQIKMLQNENRHLTETYDIDRSNWNMQLQFVEKELGGKKESEKKLQAELRSSQSELREVKEELHSIKLSFDRITSEAGFVKKNSEAQREAQTKNFEMIEATYNKQSVEQQQRIKQLELQVRRLKEEVKTSEKTAEYWKKELSNPVLKVAVHKRAVSSAKTLDLGTPGKKKAKRSLAKSVSRPQFNESKPSATERTKTVSFTDSFDPSADIRILEQEILSLNRQYKQLLQETSVDAIDLSSLRIELNSIAEQMEFKTSRLYELKRKLQEQLKSRILSL